MRTLVLASLLVTAAGVTSSSAQARTTLRFETAPRVEMAAAHPLPADTFPGYASVREAPTGQVLARGGFAALGWLGGGLAGALVGQSLDDREGDDQGFTGLVMGAALGSTVGSGLGAAAPRYGSRCSFQRRFFNGLLGSVAGAAAGAFLTNKSGTDEVGVLIPVGSTLGAALAVGC